MSVYSNIIRRLEKGKFEYKTFKHGPVYTSEQAAKVRNVPLKTGVKAMILKSLENKFFLVLIPADKKVDLKKMAELEGTDIIVLAKPNEVFEISGCKVGAVPPFGHKAKLKTYFDKDILENEWANFNAGEHKKSIRMRSKDLVEIINPITF